MKPFRFIDLFCGGGGATTGIINALNSKGMNYEGVVIDHWNTAIQTQKENHPELEARCAAMEDVTPDEIFSDQPTEIDLAWASPSCTHHSTALGDKPRSNQLRSQPDMLLPYLRLTKIKRMFIENVQAFTSWGPLLDTDICFDGKKYKAGNPDPREKGKFFRDWIESVKCLGYCVDYKVMNAADFGAPTSRSRLIIQLVRIGSGLKIVWPTPTHAKTPVLFSERPWIPARDILDLSITGQSIFNRKKPLSDKTLKRIEFGIKKYWGQWAEPFLIIMRGTKEKQLESSAIQVHAPLPTITTSCHAAVIEPLFIPQHSPCPVKPVTQPLSTIATTGSISLVQPLIFGYMGQDKPMPVDETLKTILTHDRFALLQDHILQDAQGNKYKLDITFRMLTPLELAAAMSFPKNYKFVGTKTQALKQIGNAVCPKLAQALVESVI